MERYITDVIYNNLGEERRKVVDFIESSLYKELSVLVSEEKYMEFEVELNRIFSEIEKELFCYGFSEGIRFWLKSLR